MERGTHLGLELMELLANHPELRPEAQRSSSSNQTVSEERKREVKWTFRAANKAQAHAQA